MPFVAALWSLSDDSIRQIFRDQPSVLEIGSLERRFTRGYISLRIPESVIQRVHTELCEKPGIRSVAIRRVLR
jgi:hypothetical protein